MPTDTSTNYEVGSTYHVPPAELVLERNIRVDAKADADLIASVAAVGVIQPIVAVVDAQGQLLVRTGHRRTLAAVEAGLPTVAVHVAGLDDSSRDAEVRRLLEQHDENTARAGLTAADELHLVDQLTLFGMTAEEITTGYRMSRDVVDKALAVRGSRLATMAAARPNYSEVTLDHLAGVAEFDEDSETAGKLLAVAVKQPDQFAHILQRERDDRDRETVRAAKTAELKADGITVVSSDLADGAARIANLLNPDTVKPITATQHKTCRGNAAYVRVEVTVVNGERRLVGHTEWICTDWRASGHRHALKAFPGAGSPAPERSDVEKDKAAKHRRLVVENNKAWEAAEAVRREWLAALARRKTPPKGWAAFVVDTLSGNYSRGRELLGEHAGVNIGHADLGLPVTVDADKDGALATLMWVLASYEGGLTRDSWRENGKYSVAGRYLRFLDSIGYPLSDVEIYATSTRTA